MAHSITGKLNRPASQFEAGTAIGFGVSIGVKYRDPVQKVEFYQNYEAVLFASKPAQLEFYQSALVAGAIIEISGQKQRVKLYQDSNGAPMTVIEILDAKLGFAAKPA